ncbi:MAG: protein kinase [Elusimicrobia bacterium]|nr:protein kinase [Elusimicrobiota bacterium]
MTTPLPLVLAALIGLSGPCAAQGGSSPGPGDIPEDVLELVGGDVPAETTVELPEEAKDLPPEQDVTFDPKERESWQGWVAFETSAKEKLKRLESLSDEELSGLEAEIIRFTGQGVKDKVLSGAINKLNERIIQLRNTRAQEVAAKPPTTQAEAEQRNRLDRVSGMFGEMYKGMAVQEMRTDPQSPEGFSRYGFALVMEGKYRQAAPVLERAVRLGAKDSRTFSSYGTAAFHLGDFALARSAAGRALKIDPQNDAAFAVMRLSEGKNPAVTLPSVLTGGGSGEGVFSAAAGNEAVSGAPSVQAGAQPAAAGRAPMVLRSPEAGKSSAFAKEAAAALAVKDYLRAIESATRAIEANDGNAQAWNYRAIANSKLGRYDAAVRDASHALALAPKNPAALHTRSWALNKLGRFQEGLTDADEVLAREPDNAFALQNRAFSLAGLGDRRGMLAALKRAAEIEKRFQARYEKAVQVPENADVLFLFDQDPGLKPGTAPEAEAGAKAGRGLLIPILAGAGFLAALAAALSLARWWKTSSSGLGASGNGGGAVLRARGEAGAFWKKYKLVREVGNGGMGVVYEAEDTSLGRRVAIKKMRDEIRLDRKERERFLQEARTVASLRHPNIVEIYSIVEDAGEVYLVFEFAEGKTLHEVLSDGAPLPFDAALRVLKDACEAVDCAHRARIVHRDIKPSNIMVTDSGPAKVMDFGVARQAKDAATRSTATSVAGTPPYMAPESEQGTVGPRGDVYGLAVVFYEMLTGKLPFAGTGAGMLLNKMNRKFDALSQAAPGLPAGIDAVMSRALAPEPGERFKTAGEFLAAVQGLKAS